MNADSRFLLCHTKRDAKLAPQETFSFRPNGNSPSVRHFTRELLLCVWFDLSLQNLINKQYQPEYRTDDR